MVHVLIQGKKTIIISPLAASYTDMSDSFKERLTWARSVKIRAGSDEQSEVLKLQSLNFKSQPFFTKFQFAFDGLNSLLLSL